MIKKLGDNLSIVLQGVVDIYTSEIVKSYRKIFPESEIILSTWDGEDLFFQEIDKIIKNKDPQALISKIDPIIYCNINRQIVSSKAGIENASRKYILKVRSDIAAVNSSITHLFNQYEDGKGRILIGNTSAKNPKGLYKAYFHFSDWYMLSNKNNIRELFQIPIMDERDFELNIKYKNEIYYKLLSVPRQKYSAETYIWKHYVEKKYDVKIEYEFDVNKKIVWAQEEMLKNNLIIINNKDSGLQIQKKMYKNVDKKLYFEYTMQDWKIINNYEINEPYIHYKFNLYINKIKGFLYILKCFLKKL